jgi:hypothetical protein
MSVNVFASLQLFWDDLGAMANGGLSSIATAFRYGYC